MLVEQHRLQGPARSPQHGSEVNRADRQRIGPESLLVGGEFDPAETTRITHRQTATVPAQSEAVERGVGPVSAVEQPIDRRRTVHHDAPRHAEVQAQRGATNVDQQQLAAATDPNHHLANERISQHRGRCASFQEPRVGGHNLTNGAPNSSLSGASIQLHLDELRHTWDASAMHTRHIGPLEVSTIGLGCNNFGMRLDADQTKTVVHAALDVGINFFDTADVYGNGLSEEFVGQSIKGRRHEIVLATKFGAGGMDVGFSGGEPEWIRRAVDRSLRRLNTDWIDLYQFHTPDASVPLADTMGTLNELVIAGKVRAIGCSNFDADLIGESAEIAADLNLASFASVQNRMSVLHRDGVPEVLTSCDEFDLAFLPYFPLESGLLTGKVGEKGPPKGTRLAVMDDERRARFLDDERLERVNILRSYASNHGQTILELAMSWLLNHQQVASVIAGATSVEQIGANALAGDWVMSADVMGEIDEIVKVDKNKRD